MLDQLSPLTMIQLDFIQMNDYPAASCTASPTAFLLTLGFGVYKDLYTENTQSIIYIFPDIKKKQQTPQEL